MMKSGRACSMTVRTESRSRRSDSMSVTRSWNPSMCSILLRQRTEPNTSAPRSSAYSARWLPTKPVIPVIKIRIVAIVLHPMRRAAHTRGTTDGAPARAGHRERQEGTEREERAPPGIGAASHRPPAHPRLGAQPVVVAYGRHTARRQAPDHERLGQVREPREAGHAHPEVVVLRDRERGVVPPG